MIVQFADMGLFIHHTTSSVQMLLVHKMRHMMNISWQAYSIFNEEELRIKIKMVDVQLRGCACRIRTSAFDLLSIRDVLVVKHDEHHNNVADDDDDETDQTWDFIGSTLRLNTTFMYINFHQMISHVPKDEREYLTHLANKLFQSIEEVNTAVKMRNISLTYDRYDEAASILQEVVTSLPRGLDQDD